jgi:hypothetical protein
MTGQTIEASHTHLPPNICHDTDNKEDTHAGNPSDCLWFLAIMLGSIQHTEVPMNAP